MSLADRIRVTKQTRRSVGGFLTAFVVLLLLMQLFHLQPLELLQRPLSAMGSRVGHFFSLVRNYQELTSELTTLQGRVEFLSLERADIEQLKKENRELQGLLAFSGERSDTIEARSTHVLTRTIDNSRAQMLVDIGTMDDVEEGMVAVVEKGLVLGTVVKTHSDRSVVRLLTDLRSRIAVRLEGSETVGIAEGTKGSLLRLSYIPQSIEVNVGQLVYTSGLEERIPSGLIVGIVTDVHSDDTEPFQTATVEPLVDLRSFQVLQILIPPKL